MSDVLARLKSVLAERYLTPATRFLSLFLSAVLTVPAAAQLRTGDSLAVIRTVERYHAALAAGDTTALKGILSYGATVMNAGFAGPLAGRSLESAMRFDRAIIRRPTSVAARVMGLGAYVYTVSKLSSRTEPDGNTNDEAESIFLSRLGDTWFIELVHITVKS